MTRSFLRAVAGGLVGALVTAQMLIAAYACPALLSPIAANLQVPGTSASPAKPGDMDVGMPMAQSSHCDGIAGTIDTSPSSLCAEHCKYGQQSDHAPTLNAPAAVLTALYAMPRAPETATSLRPATASLSALVAACPPHAILHCVYRI